MQTKKSNGKIKKQKVNYTSREKGKTKINSRVDTNVVKTGVKIGKNALRYRKYDAIWVKQREAQKRIDASHSYLKSDHYAYTMLSEQKRMFFHKRGLRSPSKLSFKNLTDADLKAYENLLDSINNNTYFDKAKYEEYKKTNIENLKEKFFTDEQKTKDIDKMASDMIDILENQVAQDLIKQGFKYELRDEYNEFYDDGLTVEEFTLMLKDFSHNRKVSDTTLDDFLEYSLSWREHYIEFVNFVNLGKFNEGDWELYKSEYIDDNDVIF